MVPLNQWQTNRPRDGADRIDKYLRMALRPGIMNYEEYFDIKQKVNMTPDSFTPLKILMKVVETRWPNGYSYSCTYKQYIQQPQGCLSWVRRFKLEKIWVSAYILLGQRRPSPVQAGNLTQHTVPNRNEYTPGTMSSISTPFLTNVDYLHQTLINHSFWYTWCLFSIKFTVVLLFFSADVIMGRSHFP